MEEQKHVLNCHCDDCVGERQFASLQVLDNERRHLEHPFYGDANKYREDVRREQILKGAAKYPEPFNPKSWTAKELLQHAMQENVDQAHYIFGLYEKISEIEAESDKMHFSISENFELRQENENLKQEIKILKQALKGFLIFFANDKKEL